MFNFPGVWILRIVLVFLILNVVPAFGLTMHELTNDHVTFEWVSVDNIAQWTESRLRWIDIELEIPLVTEVKRTYMPSLTTTLNRPRLGRWAVEIRSCANYKLECVDGKVGFIADPDGTFGQCSIWTKSDVQGSPNPWAIYWKPAPVTGINIFDEVVP